MFDLCNFHLFKRGCANSGGFWVWSSLNSALSLISNILRGSPLQNLVMKCFPEFSLICSEWEFWAEIFVLSECPSKTSPKTSPKTSLKLHPKLGRGEKTPTPKTRVSIWTLLRTPGRFTTRPLLVHFTTKMSVVRPFSVLSKDEIGP